MGMPMMVKPFFDSNLHELPILGELRRLETDEARADWLLRLPLIFFATHSEQIRVVLRECGFTAGLHYIDAERVGLLAKRLPDGTAAHGPVLSVHLARIDLKVAARGGRGC